MCEKQARRLESIKREMIAMLCRGEKASAGDEAATNDETKAPPGAKVLQSRVTMYTRGGFEGSDDGLAAGTPQTQSKSQEAASDVELQGHVTSYSRGQGGGDHALVQDVPATEYSDMDSRMEFPTPHASPPPPEAQDMGPEEEAADAGPMLDPVSECDSDIPGLAPYTETVRFLETYADKLETLEQEQGDKEAAEGEATGHPRLASLALKIALSLIFAYEQCEQVRAVADPAIQVASEKVAVASAVASKAAGNTGAVLARHMVPVGASVGEAAASTSKALGAQVFVLGKSVGKSIGETTMEASKVVTGVVVSTGKDMTDKAHDAGKRLASKVAASTASSAKALLDQVIGPPPAERQAAIDVGYGGSGRAVYTYVGDKPVGMVTPAHPSLSGEASAHSSSSFCGTCSHALSALFLSAVSSYGSLRLPTRARRRGGRWAAVLTVAIPIPVCRRGSRRRPLHLKRHRRCRGFGSRRWCFLLLPCASHTRLLPCCSVVSRRGGDGAHCRMLHQFKLYQGGAGGTTSMQKMLPMLPVGVLGTACRYMPACLRTGRP